MELELKMTEELQDAVTVNRKLQESNAEVQDTVKENFESLRGNIRQMDQEKQAAWTQVVADLEAQVRSGNEQLK